MISPCCAGMHSWLAAAADTRYSVVVPIIGVQVGLILNFNRLSLVFTMWIYVVDKLIL